MDHFKELQEIIEQYNSGLLTDKEFWAKILELAVKAHSKLD